MYNVYEKTYTDLPDFDKREILRYAGVKGDVGEQTLALLDECLQECRTVFSYRVCYCELTQSAFLERILAANESESLARFLEDSEQVTVFAATVGLGVDRLINRYVSVSPVKALFFQAIGAERIEALCENFCKELGLKKRFSPGYGDFALAAQREIFSLLGCEKRIGLSLTDSLLMTPTKSVTAIAY